MSAEKTISLALSQAGITEYPAGTNSVKYNSDYYGRGVSGPAYPWCVTFLWWVFNNSGEQFAFFGGAKTASCGTLLNWYRQMGWAVDVKDANPGDILILNFSGTKDTQHCGIVTKVLGTGRFQTVEGNTTPGEEGSQDNGGSVAIKTRYAYQVVGVCRPQYKPDSPSDYAGHWAEEAIRWAVDWKLMQGFPDGSFKPDEPVTRAQLAEVLWRLREVIAK